MLSDPPASPEARMDDEGDRTYSSGKPAHHTPTNRKLTIRISQDRPYLSDIITEIEKEHTEREDLESMVIQKPKVPSK